MSTMSNHERFPQNILEPRIITVDSHTYTLYTVKFKGLYDLYNYLKSNPTINRKVWTGRISSVDSESHFAGKPYDEAVEDLIGGIDPGYEEFLKIEKKLSLYSGSYRKYVQIRSLAGGHVNVPLYTVGSPIIYEVSRVVSNPKFININVMLSYPWYTSKDAVFNRAIIITNIIKALEREGYTVNVNAFELSEKRSELFQIIFDIKNYGGKISYPALYKSLCNVEFLRRICFRLLETSDVTEEWNSGYGKTCEECFAKRILKLNKNDLYFSTPEEMNIKGQDLSQDFESAIKYLNLEGIIDASRETKKIEEKVRVLKK